MTESRNSEASKTSQHWSRRTFLQAGTLACAGASGLGFAKAARAEQTATADAVIQIILSGGPSQLDTWDPKPAAPASIRGPFRPIATSVPGMKISELFPEMARRAGQFAIVRSLHHDEAPVHEVGLEILNTGRDSAHRTTPVAVGERVSLLRPSVGARSWAWLGGAAKTARRSSFASGCYGGTSFGDHCQEAVRLVEAGTRLVTINMFPTLYNTLSWDCHANAVDLPTTLDDYRTTVGPMFDLAFSGLLDDLSSRGLLQRTLVVCAGEFGRSPNLNPRGGRDHWTGVWSAIFAGGGVRGGQVIGSSDAYGAEPRDVPVKANQVAATVLHTLGIAPSSGEQLLDGRGSAGMSSRPIHQLF
jgi:uncharacterized protein (DUF1501 family)